jgi:hypothetical protein
MSKMSTVSTVSKNKNQFTTAYLNAVLRKRINDKTFEREQFKTEFGLDTKAGDRRVRRWINNIAAELDQEAIEEMAIITKYCRDNIKAKAANGSLDDSIAVKLVLANITKEVHVKKEITENKNVNINVKGLLSEYNSLFNTTNNNNDCSAEPAQNDGGTAKATVSNNNST